MILVHFDIFRMTVDICKSYNNVDFNCHVIEAFVAYVRLMQIVAKRVFLSNLLTFFWNF